MTEKSFRLSKGLLHSLAQLIRDSADKLRSEDEHYFDRGLPVSSIAHGALEAAMEACSMEFRSTVGALLSRMVPVVLGSREDQILSARQPMILGLDLPEWYCVPTAEGRAQPGWKKDEDVTPNELTRIIAHRDEDIRGRQVERNKLVILRDTALEAGCAPDAPLSSVFETATEMAP